MRVVHPDGWRDEDEVNLLALEWRNLAEIVIGVDGSSVVGRHMIGVVHLELVGRHCGIGFVVFCDIEVASYYCRLLSDDFLNLLHDELSAFPSCSYAHVVEVRIDGHEDFARFLVLKFCITGNTFEGSVPTYGTRHFRRLAQPEVSFLQNLEPVLEEEDRRVLSGLFTIVAPYPNIVVFGHTGKQVLELSMQNFLHTDDIDFV